VCVSRRIPTPSLTSTRPAQVLSSIGRSRTRNLPASHGEPNRRHTGQDFWATDLVNLFSSTSPSELRASLANSSLSFFVTQSPFCIFKGFRQAHTNRWPSASFGARGAIALARRSTSARKIPFSESCSVEGWPLEGVIAEAWVRSD